MSSVMKSMNQLQYQIEGKQNAENGQLLRMCLAEDDNSLSEECAILCESGAPSRTFFPANSRGSADFEFAKRGD